MNNYCLGLLMLILVCMIIHSKKDIKEGISNSVQSGTCESSESESILNYHSCNLREPEEKKIDMRYVSTASPSLYNSTDFLYDTTCPQTYVNNITKLLNSSQKRQYAGYSENKYIDRIKYMEPLEPLPVNPDFFVSGGGTFA